ncbi:hypothetical protein [Xanthobacter agilis]|uniref:hypothetical protein n=1 Tax=Xanthobacter agilis TaxID=47492 RepID=UPI0037297A7A
MKKPLVIGIVAVLVLGIGGYAGVQYWAEKKAYSVIENALTQVRATGAKASVGSSAVSLKTRGLTLGDLSVTSADGSVSLAVGRLSALGVGAPQNGRITADSVTLENVTLTRTDGADGARVVETLPQVTIEKYAGPLVVTPTAGNAADLVNASPVVLALRQLAAVDAARIDVPHAVTRMTPAKTSPQPAPQPTQARELTLDGIAVTDVRTGKIARFSVARIASEGLPDGAAPASQKADQPATPAQGSTNARPDVAQPDDAQPDEGSSLPRVTASAILARDIDLTPLLSAGGDDLRPVLGALEAGAFTIEQADDIRTEGASLTLTGVALKPAAITAARLAALKALSADDPPADPAPLLADAGALLKGMAFATFQIKDMRTIEPVGGGRAAVFALDTFRDGVLSELRVEGVDGDTDGRAVKFGRIAVTGLDLPRLLTLAHAEDPTQPDVALGGFRALTGLTASDIEIPTDGSDDTPSRPLHIGRAGLTWGDFSTATGDLPGRFRFELIDVTGPIDPEDGEPFNTLAAAGLKQATFSLAIGTVYDAGTQSLSLSPAEVEVKDAFRTTFTARLDNLPAGALASESAFVAALAAANIGPASLTITDHGLANLMLQRLADAEGQSLDDYRAHLLDLLNQGIAAAAPNAPEAAAVGEAIARFIRDPKTLEITATPKGRVPFLAFVNSDDPLAPLQLFSFTATNKP